MKHDKNNHYRVNEQIRVKEVRIVSDDGSTVVPTRQALDMARSQGVDLVEISPNAQPPVCRLIDYSKFLYQQKMDRERREAEAKALAMQANDNTEGGMPAGGGLFANAKNGADALKKLNEGGEE